ncbi:hypothetical protein AALP_AAs63184U000100, partial [Arabis alpina]
EARENGGRNRALCDSKFNWQQQFRRRYLDEFLDIAKNRAKGEYQMDYVYLLLELQRLTRRTIENSRINPEGFIAGRGVNAEEGASPKLWASPQTKLGRNASNRTRDIKAEAEPTPTICMFIIFTVTVYRFFFIAGFRIIALFHVSFDFVSQDLNT